LHSRAGLKSVGLKEIFAEPNKNDTVAHGHAGARNNEMSERCDYLNVKNVGVVQ
jgi:hypothetical protein